MKPTKEQEDIISAFKTNKVIKINAVAGSGKSTTLKLLAEDNIAPSLYVCFNKDISISTSAKFPSHVDCRTSHSLAYAAFGKYLSIKMQPKNHTAKSASGIAEYYALNDFPCENADIPARVVARFAKLVVSRFQNSDHTEISSKLLPDYLLKELIDTHTFLDVTLFKLEVIAIANKLWKDRINYKSPVYAEHDTYLKLWQLSKPKLPYDVIYVDEAQDTNPAVLDVILNQTHARIAYVGDSFQSIYAFRMAVNAMQVINAPSYLLSKSFRYGQDIADVASYIINNRISIIGADISSKLQNITSKKYSMIFRTNAVLLDKAVELIGKGKKVKTSVDTWRFLGMLSSADALYHGNNKGVKDDSISLFSSWEELKEASEDDPELKWISRITENRLVNKYTEAIKQLKDTKVFDIELTTAHKSKGLEFDNVIIADDFPLHLIKPEGDKQPNEQEVNLFYVACTRAIHNLQLPEKFLLMYEDYKYDKVKCDFKYAFDEVILVMDEYYD